MARKRTIDPDSWTDDKLADLSMYAHLLWVGLVSLADDDGRIEWSARQFKFRLFAVKPEATTETVSAWMAEIMDHEAIKVYTVDGKQYAYHPAWRKHQYVNKPAKSKIPPPPGFVPPEPPQKTEPSGDSEDKKSEEPPNPPVASENPPELPAKNQEDTKPQVPSGTVSGSGTESGNSAPSGAGARSEPERTSPSKPKAVPPSVKPWDLAEWVWDQGFARGIIGKHKVKDRDASIRRDLTHAKVLIDASYPVAEIKTRAVRFLDGIAAGRNATPSCAGLSAAWDYPWVAGKSFQATTGPNASRPDPATGFRVL